MPRCEHCIHSAKYQIGDRLVCKRHVNNVLSRLLDKGGLITVHIKKVKIYQATFKIPKTGGIMIVSNYSPDLLEPAVEELKNKGFIFVKKNW